MVLLLGHLLFKGLCPIFCSLLKNTPLLFKPLSCFFCVVESLHIDIWWQSIHFLPLPVIRTIELMDGLCNGSY